MYLKLKINFSIKLKLLQVLKKINNEKSIKKKKNVSLLVAQVNQHFSWKC